MDQAAPNRSITASATLMVAARLVTEAAERIDLCEAKPFEAMVQTVEAARQRIGLAELSRRADVAYTTARDACVKHGWRPRQVAELEKLYIAARRLAEVEAA